MACNCTKCSSTCSCSDTALTNACTYTDCSVGSERCDDIQCAECVSYCGTSFQIGDTAAMLTPYALLTEANSAFNSGSGTTIDGSNNIDLGSALDAPTVISGTEVNNLSLNFSDAGDRSAKIVFQAADGLSMRGYSTDAYGGDSGFVAIDSTKVSMVQYDGAAEKSIILDTSQMIIRDDDAGKGLYYLNDYSPQEWEDYIIGI